MNEPRILPRRTLSSFRYSLTFLDGSTVALLEVDNGDPNDTRAKREPTRRICVASAAAIDHLQELCDEWNAKNEHTQRAWSPYIDPE